MREIETQLSFEDVSREYKEFVEKFKPKKTTDDCYTPENVYEAVKDWACKRYNIDPSNVVRPFWPGGDYERFEYTQESVVIDNPPFSIISQICAYYNRREIPFFLFSPYLTNLGIGGGGANVHHIVCGADIMYENGAIVKTAFVTNMDEYLVQSCPELLQIIKAENDKNVKATKKELPKYCYPDYVLTATDLGYMANHGVEFKVKKESCFFTRGLDSQKKQKKVIFGSGYLLSEKAAAEKAAAEKAAAEKAAAEKAAAEKAAAEKAAAIRWSISDREMQIIKSLK